MPWRRADVLILSRKTNESIVIGGVVRVTIVAVNGGQVRVGIDAPQNVAVDREEIHERKRAGQPAPVRD